MVANNVVFQLKKLDRHIPALAIASAISERLTDLRQNGRILEAVNASGNSQRYLMYSEATRRQTFLQWPHMDYKYVQSRRIIFLILFLRLCDPSHFNRIGLL